MIFYFSATGNCKYAAQRIAASTGEAIHSITECVKQHQYHFSSDNGTVGIITPTYAWGLPSIVRDILHALVLDEHPSYLWFLTTYGTTTGQTGRFANEIMRKTSHFKVENSCIGCGLCAKNCPVSAIEIRNKKPVWVKDRCVMCLSCLHHCPKFAIQYENRTKKHGQYTNPNVK